MGDMIERLKKKLFYARRRAIQRSDNSMENPVLTIQVSPRADQEIHLSRNAIHHFGCRGYKDTFDGYVYSINPSQQRDIRIVER